MKQIKIIICNTTIPFVTGGNELFAQRLTEEFNSAGYNAELISFPFLLKGFRKNYLINNCNVWKTLDLSKSADVVIPLKFPSWMVKHQNKIVYLNHQFRRAYDLFNSPYGPVKNQITYSAKEYVKNSDTKYLGTSKKLFSVSKNVQKRLYLYNKLESEVLYHSLPYEGKYFHNTYGDYILGVGRLVKIKRFDLLIQAMSHTQSPARCIIAGTGNQFKPLQKLVHTLGVEHKVILLGWVSDDDLIKLYANSLGVYYAPIDEDYGLVTLEAFKSYKPVLTTPDSGEILEFVKPGFSGEVLPKDPVIFAEQIDRWYYDRTKVEQLGKNGYEIVNDISWSKCISRLAEFF
ncbi:glycosyltransferase [Bacillus sp. Marseille-P3661]|uniref:glycosyltransferase n=1 Tax=Bacillus sp. Marseille-P3661 TaxID=1936234 RepID=UPI000C81FA3F|nr:glycosyltransferase [Bacillus sp. Marseille-P3661]